MRRKVDGFRCRQRCHRERTPAPEGVQGEAKQSLLLFSSGFTLIEVIVTLTILGFIILMVSGTFRLGLSSWEKGDSIKEDFQKIRMISQLVSRQIKSAVPYKIKTEKAEGNYLAFDGKAHSLRFVSALAIKPKRPEGFVYVVYQLKDEGEKNGRLILYEQRALNRNFFEDDSEGRLSPDSF